MSSGDGRVDAADAATAGRQRWRTILAVLLIVLGCVLAPLAGVAVWARNQVTNTDRYVRTVAPLASDPAIQQAIADQITTQIFTYLDVQGLTSQVAEALAQRGEPRIRLHDVRHSYATAALKAGISAKVISERLGHTSVAFTLQTYGHVIPGMDRDAAATVADLILGGTRKGPGTVVPDPSTNKTANNGPQSDATSKEVKDERPAR